jgi:endonuclease III
MTYFGRAVEDPAIIARIAEILEQQWDPHGVVRDGLRGEPDFYRAQATIVAGMLSADARDTEVQRYLRQLEEEALPAISDIHWANLSPERTNGMTGGFVIV